MTEPMRYGNFGDAMRAALDWLGARKVELKEAFEGRMGSFGMRSSDGSGGYRVEFDPQHQAHINVWCHSQKGPHYVFPGNENAVKAIWRQLFSWDKNLKWRTQPD